MQKILMLKGLPASGKSTFAKQLLEQENKGANWLDPTPAIRTNKDEIRQELRASLLGGREWDYTNRTNESIVHSTENGQILKALQTGVELIIVDDTNLDRKRKVELMAMATEHDATFEVKEFPTSVEECIERDKQRTEWRYVGEDVIRNMAKKYNYPPPPASVPVALSAPVVQNGQLMKALICDLDGTLALFGNKRPPYDASKCALDDLNKPVRRVLELFYRHMMYQIIYLSGREDKYRHQTDDFLRIHTCPPGPLYMRSTGDTRKDWIVKGELFNAHVRGKYDIDFVLDDRNQVVNYWRSIGLTCFQVAAGEF